jgi:hypothetical protein
VSPSAGQARAEHHPLLFGGMARAVEGVTTGYTPRNALDRPWQLSVLSGEREGVERLTFWSNSLETNSKHTH